MRKTKIELEAIAEAIENNTIEADAPTTVIVRMNKSDLNELDMKRAELGLNRSDFIRIMLRGIKGITITPQIEPAVVTVLAEATEERSGNND